MTLVLEKTNKEMLVLLGGELDHHAARSLREQIDTAVERAKPEKLRLDFRDVGFMDSSGIGLIMGRYRLMQLMGGSLVICGMSERIETMMRLAGLEKLDIWDTGSGKPIPPSSENSEKEG